MGEIIYFPEINSKQRLTATGRFLLAVDEQLAEEQKSKRMVQKISVAKVSVAKKELEHIFNSENMELANELYVQGMRDVVHERHSSEEREIYFLSPGRNVASKIMVYEVAKYTDAALFYMHVQSLESIAATVVAPVTEPTAEQSTRYQRIADITM